jgi:DNA-binding NtrC family response regulator
MKSRAADRTVLVVDDDLETRSTVRDVLATHGFTVEVAPDARTGLDLLGRHSPAVVVLDLGLPDMGGLEALPEIRTIEPEVPVIVLTGQVSVSTAVEAMRRGAYDYLPKPWRPEELVLRVNRALERRSLASEVRSLRQRLAAAAPLRDSMGFGSAVASIVRQVDQVASSALSVLIQGETGTGKELVARAIHAQSQRRDGPFVAVDCGAIPDTLIESELFGHERGAFTGAHGRKPGRFQQAEGGTLFLDEVSSLSAATQPKLLRVLQERQVQPLGAVSVQPIDVRIVAAANVSLEAEMRAGRFRQDLFYRLAEFVITLRPLRDRPEDIPHLANRFLAEARMDLKRPVGGFSPEALARLTAHRWPGNVRELRNVVRRAVLLSTDVVDAEALGSLADDEPGAPGPSPTATLPTRSLKEAAEQAVIAAESQAISAALQRTGGNKSEAARLLRTDYKTLYLKMKRYGLSAGFSDRPPGLRPGTRGGKGRHRSDGDRAVEGPLA